MKSSCTVYCRLNMASENFLDLVSITIKNGTRFRFEVSADARSACSQAAFRGPRRPRRTSNPVSQVLARPSEWLELFDGATVSWRHFFLLISAHNIVCRNVRFGVQVQQSLQHREKLLCSAQSRTRFGYRE